MHSQTRTVVLCGSDERQRVQPEPRHGQADSYLMPIGAIQKRVDSSEASLSRREAGDCELSLGSCQAITDPPTHMPAKPAFLPVSHNKKGKRARARARTSDDDDDDDDDDGDSSYQPAEHLEQAGSPVKRTRSTRTSTVDCMFEIMLVHGRMSALVYVWVHGCMSALVYVWLHLCIMNDKRCLPTRTSLASLSLSGLRQRSLLLSHFLVILCSLFLHSMEISRFGEVLSKNPDIFELQDAPLQRCLSAVWEAMVGPLRLVT